MRFCVPLLLVIACGQSPSESVLPAATDGGPQGPDPHGVAPGGQGFQNMDQGQQHPPLPADNPAWDWDAGGFVSDFGWYGEHSWGDVRMRLAGHLSVIGRDRARIHAQQGDFAAAALSYGDLATMLDGLDVPSTGTSAELVAHLRAAAHRDHTLLAWLAADGGHPPPLDDGEGLEAIRQGVLALERDQKAGIKDELLAARAKAFQERLTPFLVERPDLALDAFEDFNSRHTLRIKLFEARMTSLDPLGFGDRWGYWKATEIKRQALILGMVLKDLGGNSWQASAEESLGPLPELDAVTYFTASAWGARTSSLDNERAFTVEGLGSLPTGDSLIDVGAQPGPLAIGTLMKLGLEDPEHRIWLVAAAARLNEELSANPFTIPTTIAELSSELDAYGHGSRYYNIKQLRNEAVRVLARSGETALAREILLRNFPLHNQDWACPNRQGILEAIEGRLLAQGGDLVEAEQALARAWQSSVAFLELVSQAEAAGSGKGPGKRPPMIGQGGKQGPPGPPPNR